MRRLAVILSLIAVLSLACGSSSSPTAPTPPATSTRIITLSGNLAFGNVNPGSYADSTLTIANSGSTALTVTSVTISGASGTVASGWTGGSIAAGGTQASTIRFTPTAELPYSGVVTVVCDSTTGTNTIDWSGTGANTATPWTNTGTGDAVFTMPMGVSRVKITGDYTGYGMSFTVDIAGVRVVDQLLGKWYLSHFEETYATTGGVVEITNAPNVLWSFTEVR
jgi:hypothetical protein